MRKKLIGIDLGKYSTKLCVLEEAKGYFYIKHKKSYPTPEIEGAKYMAWLKKTVVSFAKEFGLHPNGLAASFAEGSPERIVLFLEMPKIEGKELAQSIAYEIQEKAPIENVDEYHYKWQKVYEGKENDNIILVIVQNEWLRTLKRLKLGFQRIKVIEPHISSLGRLLTGNVGVIDFGHSGTRFMAYRDGKPFFFKEIPIGGKDLTQIIADEFEGVRHIAERAERLRLAEEFKHQRARVLQNYEIEQDPVARRLASLLEGQIQSLVGEIKQAFRLAQVANGFTFEKLYYTGGAANLKYLINFVSRELDFDLEQLDIMPSSEAEERDDDYLFTYAYSAALSEEYPYLTNTNLADVKPIAKLNSKEILGGVVAFTFLFLAGTFSIGKIYDMRLKAATTTLTQVQESLREVATQAKNVQDVAARYERLRKSVDFVTQQKHWLSEILYLLPGASSDGVALKSIVIMERDPKLNGSNDADKLPYDVALEGYAKDYSQIGFFAIPLEKIGTVTITQVYDLGEEGSGVYLKEAGDLKKGFVIVLRPFDPDKRPQATSQ